MVIFVSEQQYFLAKGFNGETFYHSLKKPAAHQMI
jgi:hypothetical protein